MIGRSCCERNRSHQFQLVVHLLRRQLELNLNFDNRCFRRLIDIQERDSILPQPP